MFLSLASGKFPKRVNGTDKNSSVADSYNERKKNPLFLSLKVVLSFSGEKMEICVAALLIVFSYNRK